MARIAPSTTPGALAAALPALALAFALAVQAAPPSPAANGAPLRYNRAIRPLLSENCFPCHGPDRNKRQAGLRLDRRADALASGVIVPGHPERSRLTARVLATDTRQMPPAASHKSLTAAQKATLQRWIAQGAVYEAHWAYTPLVRPAVPKVAGARSPIDAFIRARLAQEKLPPSPEADRRTLIRRVTLDLSGLPPTPEEADAFVRDRSPGAYEKVVDRLLAAPAYGERMATPWLDTVRYADTVGYHGDQNMNAWAYRDWVVDAFNKNLPFDRFTTEQIAGDLLPDATDSQRTATCFSRLNMVTREGGAQPGEYLHKYAADRVRTVGMAWLGSTFACAECHDHKYDPITQKDFYSLAAFFADVKQWGVYADYDYTPNPELRGVGNDHPFFPEITVTSEYLKARIARTQREIDTIAARARFDALAFDRWRADMQAFLNRHPFGWEGGEATPGETASVTLQRPYPIAALRLELLPVERSVLKAGTAAATIGLTAEIIGRDGKARPVPFRYAAADVAEPRYQNSFALLGVHQGWRLKAEQAKGVRTSVWLPQSPIRTGEGETLRLTRTGEVARWRLSTAPIAPENPDAVDLPDDPLVLLNDATRARRAWLMATASDPDAFARAVAAEAEIAACRQGKTPVMVVESVAKPQILRVLPRGNWQDESGAVTPPAAPGFLPAGAGSAGRQTRLDLARWLVSPTNPLTPRVFVNRLWKQFFGVGLSPSIEDVGAQGEAPSHPELLDYLAIEFRRDWDVKRLVRLLVTSATYRQSSTLRPDIVARDPSNRLLACQNARRLEAEFVRDNALAIAGLLNRAIGGPPVKPYQPPGYYAQLQFPDREYTPERDDGQWRRGLYMHWQRTFLHPMLANFDAPSREDAVCTRTVANTPQQALTLLNDPEFVEASRAFAAGLLEKPGDDAARIDRAYRRALARPPKPRERASLRAFLTKVRAGFRARPEDARKLQAVGYAPAPASLDPIELAAWSQLCRVILNLHETITRY